jgi:hypothetical protein
MCFRLTAMISILLGAAVVASGADRLAVLEFFGRPEGTYCSAAGPAMVELQHEYRGRAVLLEYDYDFFLHGRQDRFWATGTSADYLPLVMVGSGFRVSSGSVDYERVYRNMIEDELARPPRADVKAYWRRVGNSLRAYVELRNLGPTDLEVRRDAGIWLIGYEKSNTGVSETWVRSTALAYLPYDLEPGDQFTTVIDTTPVSGLNWDHMAGLVLVEDRPRGSSAYDMAQAAEAAAADLTAAPAELALSSRGSSATVELTGPHVLEWSAEAGVPWLEVSPESGAVPATVTVTLRPDRLPPTATEGNVTFNASGDGMSFSTVVDVAVGARVRHGGRRLAAGG